jgi:hypothetical protein
VALPRVPSLAQARGGIAIAGDPRGTGYWLAAPGGVVTASGSATDVGGTTVAREIVALAAHPGGGWWVTDATGAVEPFGAAQPFSGPPAGVVGAVVGIAARPAGDGYWLATSSARVFAAGAAPHLGTPAQADSAVTAIAPHPAEDGYWLLSASGAIYAHGAAAHLGQPASGDSVGIAANPVGGGYWVVHRDGRIAAFGSSAHHGDAVLPAPAVGITGHRDGNGYWVLAADGTVVGLGSARTDPPPPPEPSITRVRGILVATSIAQPVRQLLAHARADGYRLGGWGYRSYQRQVELRRQHCGTSRYAIYEMPSSKCKPPTARPGRSMHEKGLAIDFYRAGRGGAAKPIAGTAAFRWLKRNAAAYGLYNLPSEPWHWSTNGH